MAGSASAPLLSTLSVSNSAERGEEDEIEAMEGTDWQLVQSKSAKKKQAAERGKSQPNASRSFQESARVGAKSSRRVAALKKRVIAASRMPELPSTHCKIIVRPRGGLDLRKTSCYGISTATAKWTSKEKNPEPSRTSAGPSTQHRDRMVTKMAPTVASAEL
ncbi:hypothetical protein HPB49_010176 [Dermacentor silvarum]|uniref:Uncharacterized protein n=1 Tax=Dermacentor silvarum TaxID=543639 RepID=A0ACB8C2X3_DERSI|nr:hypothetical protein HPB49_010176 [Dermacentor silvarum]